MRTHVLTASLLVILPLAAGCSRARAATTSSAAASSAVLGVAGNCPANAGSLQPGGAGTAADLNGDGYVCSRSARSLTGETVRFTVDNDATSAAGAPVETNLYRRM